MRTRNADDAVDLLHAQHERLGALLGAVADTGGRERKRRFGELIRLLRVHEAAERTVVYPAARDRTRGDARTAADCLREGARLVRLAGELSDLGPDHPAFRVKFVAFRQAATDHAAHEERDEFPLLRRFIPTQRLHLMANEIRNVQTMS